MKNCFLLLFLFSLFAGCDESVPDNGSSESSSISREGVRFRITRKPSEDENPHTREILDPSADEIEKAFAEVDWPKSGPWEANFSISSEDPHTMILRVEGTSSEDLELQFSEQPDSEGKWIHRFAPAVPITDAVEAVKSFAERSDDFRSKIAWEEN